MSEYKYLEQQPTGGLDYSSYYKGGSQPAGDIPNTITPGLNMESVQKLLNRDSEYIDKTIKELNDGVTAVKQQSLYSLGIGAKVDEKLIDVIGRKLNDSIDAGITNIMSGALGLMYGRQNAGQQMMMGGEAIEKTKSRAYAALGATEIINDPDSTKAQIDNAKGVLSGFYSNIYAGKNAFQSAGTIGNFMQTLIVMKQAVQGEQATKLQSLFGGTSFRDKVYAASQASKEESDFMKNYESYKAAATTEDQIAALEKRKAGYFKSWNN